MRRRDVGIFAGFPLIIGISWLERRAVIISPFMSGQEYCSSEQKAASRLRSHLRRAHGQLSWDGSGHGWGKALPEET